MKMTASITRRRVLSLVGASIGASIAPPRLWAQDLRWDAVVVGAGTAGLPTALFLARRGAHVLVLEKAGQIGGTLWMSTGQMSAAGTKLQKEMGITDSPERHLADIMRISKGTANREMVSRAVHGATATLDWLYAAGIRWKPQSPVASTGHEPYSMRRIWQGAESGRSILSVLQAELATVAKNVTIMTGVDVFDLHRDSDGRILGVRGRTSDGKEHVYRAANVVLASGGYMGNPEMFRELNDVPLYKLNSAWPMNTGIGVTLAIEAGGYTRGKENYLCDFGQVPKEPGGPSFAAAFVRRSGDRPEIWVNAYGKRFIREDEQSANRREHALVNQHGHRYWIVFDDAAYREAPPVLRTPVYIGGREWTEDEVRIAFETGKAFAKGRSLGELASRACIDPAGLEETTRSYNLRIRESREDALGRRSGRQEIATPPFYAIQVQGGTLISMAGVAVDTDLRVLKCDGSVVPNLFAAGEMLGNCVLSGQAFCGGMMVTPALTFGRLIGGEIIELPA